MISYLSEKQNILVLLLTGLILVWLILAMKANGVFVHV